MRVKLFLLFATLQVCVFSAGGQRVDESRSDILIKDDSATVSLFIENKSAPSRVPTELSIVDPAGKDRAKIAQQLRIETGDRKYRFEIPLNGLMKTASDEIVWYRLRYRIGAVAGIASLSELMRDDFDLRAAAFERVVPGQPMRIRIRSLNPLTERGVKNVDIRVELAIDLDTESDKDKLNLSASARSGSDGFALVDLKIPEGIKPDGGELTITGKKNGVIRKIEKDLDDDETEGTVMLTTDKPLYQPGQTFNVRGVYFDTNNTVVPNADLKFTIEDEDETVVFRQTVSTSSFGIASVSWQIPANAKLGSYNVTIEADEDLREDRLYFKVSRYDLPNFSVTAKTGKPYYLISDAEADITISADYLFGKPVTQGRVRVVEENDRHWNYRKQKYDYDEGQIIEGTADAAGRYIAKFDLRKAIADLENSQWERYKDISLAAYYTDLTTNRTEQRRFDVRLTKEPIHIYLVKTGRPHAGTPLIGYVSTFYADGTPAVCDVNISDSHETVARVRTNSLGAGKFKIEMPGDQAKVGKYDLRFAAHDKKGQAGTFDESFDLEEDDVIQISTAKAIYAPGEPVEIDLRSSQESGYVYVDLVKEWAPIESAVVSLHGGRGHHSFPYSPTFKGDLLIAAYTDEEEGRCCDMRATHGIIFPEQQNLVLNAKFSKDEYRPAEDASVKFSVLDGSHRPVESAIGLGIFDKAIEERARTETEFGSYFSRFYRLLGYDRSFGSISLKDLNDLDMSRPVSPEMQLAAEVILAERWYFPTVYHSGNLDTEARSLYAESVAKQLKPIADVLNAEYKKSFDHPTDMSSLQHILSANGIDLSSVRDPWDQTYFPEFSVDRTQDIITLKSAGPDKKPGTPDDFTGLTLSFNYFTKTGEAIDRASLRYHNRTGAYIRDIKTLGAELKNEGIDLFQLKDRWNRDYRVEFEVAGRNYVIRVFSIGPDGVYQPQYYGDDFDVWKNSMDYFGDTERKINQVLDDEVNLKKKPFPRDESEFTKILKEHGLDIRTVTDGYGRPVYVSMELQSRYSDKTKIENGKTTITPVTEELRVFKIKSDGADGIVSVDDSTFATFSGVITEAYKGTKFEKAEVKTIAYSGAMGAISGTVTDPNGAVIPGATVVATDQNDESKTYSGATNDEGKFLISNVPSGTYTVRIDSMGFKRAAVSNVNVRSQSMVEINLRLEVGQAAETVEVTVSSDAQQTVNMSATSITTSSKGSVQIKFPNALDNSTPRLREYFPETLVWQPELVTDKKGKAEVNFKMADNITTWKMFAIATTKKGKVGVVEKEVTAFQSFFVDLDPPKFLTEGDEIYLPAQVRNYTDKNQKVDVTMDKADWFTFLGSGANKQQVDVATGFSQNAVFGFRAAAPVTAGKQRVTAVGQTDSDAIEKPVTVRPNGEEIVQNESEVFSGSGRLNINFPANALPNTQRAELKIYPNLFSHVAESVEGLLERPYGCGEQTISSTYPNLMILKFIKKDTALTHKAQQYLQKGYERLLGYQVSDGGFTYWGGKDTPDISLTAYALRFLNDAKGFIAVDQDVNKKAQNWLIAQQRADGSWLQRYRWENHDDPNPLRSKLTTTYVVRTLAMLERGAAARGSVASPEQAALAKGLSYLKQRNAEIDEPYEMALFGLAALDAGDIETAKQTAAQLEKMAIAEGPTAYWKLETNTPFYGWGTAGRIETTALVLQLLTRVARLDSKPAGETASRGLLFLLKNKDRYGVWYSTQTTINVLDAFLSILAGDAPARPQMLQIAINGTSLPDIQVAADRIEPVVVDLTGKLSPSSNSVEVRGPDGSPLMAQMVATHYIDWRDSTSTGRNVTDSRALRLDYKCDKSNPAVMEDVTCTVDAERIGFQGYGMLLAEIGTPPGADVSRESLQSALENDWSLSRYDVLPDRIILYMWAHAGGTKFNFKFRPRYAINAQTPASIVYDYYNPDAHATVAPLRFATKNN